MRRFAKLGTSLLWFGCVVCGLVACSEDDDTKQPRGPEDFAIAQVSTTGSALAESGGELSVGCTEPLLVWVKPEPVVDSSDSDPDPDALNHHALRDFKLRPPGGCGSENNCGWIALEATLPADAGATALRVETAAPQTVLRLDPPKETGYWQPGVWTLHVALIDSDGNPVLTDKNEPLVAGFSVNLVLIEPCPTAS